MSSRKVIRPSFHDDMEDGDVPFSQPFKKSNRDEDEFSTMSFASLNSAQEKILSKRGKGKVSKKTSKSRSKDPKAFEDNEIDSEEESDSDSDAAPVETSSRKRGKFQKVSRKSKHAPSESSSKRPVSRVREIAGLNTRNESTLYTDIRFDPAYGVADLSRTRKDYAFLDEYRQSEIGSMERMLKDRKSTELLGEREVGDLKFKLQSLKSRLDTMKNKDLETQILADHKKKQMQSFKSGEQTNPYFLKRSEQRKLVQKAKFDTMKGSQREKVMERKRKRRLGKEFRRMEYNQQE